MTVVLNTGLASDFTIGIIACSRHQSGSYMPWAQHRPRMDWCVAPNDGPAVDYVRNNLGYESTRYSRTYFKALQSEQWTGHTALFARVQGQAAFARGWVPQAGLRNYATSLLGGGEVPGVWQDDLQMIDDPTCISLEYSVKALDPLRLMEFWDDHKTDYTTYCFQTLGPGRCNCAWSAVSMLRAFALQYNFNEIAVALQKVVVPAQGSLMSQVASGDLLITGAINDLA